MDQINIINDELELQYHTNAEYGHFYGRTDILLINLTL